jgi:hypothetical protein
MRRGEAWVWLVLACSEPDSVDCTTLSDVEAADSCHYEEVRSHVSAEDLQAARQAIDRIQDPLLSSAAVHELLSSWTGPGLNLEVAMEICSMLEDDHQTSCRKTWNRPHLWYR